MIAQPSALAPTRLNAMNVRFKSRLPWAVAFSFAGATQQLALEIWRRKERSIGPGATGMLAAANTTRRRITI